MSTGNYDHDNFVRVDCAASSEQFRINAIHETAHFSLIKQSFFGLLCFFLRQDTRDARSPLEPALRTLEQAFECTNECYARAKELFLCTPFPSADLRQREAILAAQRAQPYFGRYHMERLTPILLQYDLAVRCSLFPDRLFLMAAEVDVTPLLDCGFADLRRLQSLILCQKGFIRTIGFPCCSKRSLLCFNAIHRSALQNAFWPVRQAFPAPLFPPAPQPVSFAAWPLLFPRGLPSSPCWRLIFSASATILIPRLRRRA